MNKVGDFIENCNRWGKAKKPFFFLVDFELQQPLVCPLNELDALHIKLNMPRYSSSIQSKIPTTMDATLERTPMTAQKYHQAFSLVQKHLKYGDSYLLNLTFPTRIHSPLTLEQLFFCAEAPFKLLIEDKLVVFSPERFVKIQGNSIFSYPMKGTIDASVRGAEQIILNDWKETCEHNTIVDLIRNDLSLVSNEVELIRYRYLEYINSKAGKYIQVSSEIRGMLDPHWRESIGSLLIQLLPAGSISGAPKKRTVEIIQAAEQQPRGYYTGVFGYFDGESLDSAVAIRYIETTDDTENNGMQFRSGGGITINSKEEDEYKELIDKVYVPTL